MTIRQDVLAWIEQERDQYADVKYAQDGDNRARLIDAMREEGLGDTWMNFILNYLKRAELLGVQSAQGRQALGKAIVTCMHALETSIEIFGPMPVPGVPSGEVRYG